MKTFEEWDPFMDNPLDKPYEKPVIRILSSTDGDWYGLYVNGKLEVEGHSLNYRDVIHALGFTYKSKELTEDDFRQFGWKCPRTYDEFKDRMKQKRKFSKEDPYGEEKWD